MKMLLLGLMTIAAVGQAAEVATCVNNIKSACAGKPSLLASLSQNISQKIQSGKSKCAEVQPGQQDGVERTVLMDNNDLISIITSPSSPSRCSYRVIDMEGQIKEAKQYAGRLFVLTTTGKIGVVGLNNKVQWLVNTTNDERLGVPYFNVSDMKGANGGSSVVLTFTNGASKTIGLQEIYNGLNEYKVCTIGGCQQH
ncbi:MAG: hypothetical protein JNL11_10350 [Bdellovibrionaceae bacterium]|nr:hypothetical protein [Pseudobdellovibrionaceae bacterium]